MLMFIKSFEARDVDYRPGGEEGGHYSRKGSGRMAEGRESIYKVGDSQYLKLQADTIHSKRNSEYFDPCQDFASKSIRCLHRNGGDKEMCTDYFQYVQSPLSPMQSCLQKQPNLARPQCESKELTDDILLQSISGLQERMGMCY